MQKIIIGTRGSQLSLIQTKIVADLIQVLLPNTQIETKIITTKGDRNMSPVPLDSVGKGWFTKEIDKALLTGEVDVAVHSLKDLPEILPKGLVIAAIPQRADAREALVANENRSFEKLVAGTVVGTDSTRRKSQILHKRPDLVVKSVRGNVNRRLEKFDNGEYDALFLAVAGLKRLGFEDRITEYFAESDIVPSPGQGALAVVIKNDNTSLYSLLKKLNHEPTVNAVNAERAFSAAVGGGCKMPVGAYAECQGNSLTMHAVIGSIDGVHVVKESIHGDVTDALALAKSLADRILDSSQPWYKKANEEAGSVI